MAIRFTFIFSKKGRMRFISHLDLMRLFMRAVRRAELPVKMTEGFSPHPKFSIKRALKLGIESDNEEAAFVLREQVSLPDFKQRLQKELPEGIHIREVHSEVKEDVQRNLN
ncbi:MAG: TIGR03936 family radical SAM-associated protein [Candidatus Omnitrophota bacterium]